VYKQSAEKPVVLSNKADKIPAQSSKVGKKSARDLSHSMTLLLRHRARDYGVQIDQQGWVMMDDLLHFVNSVGHGGSITLEDIRAVVRTSDKQRFAIWERYPLMVRANQGRSMDGITPDLAPLNLEEIPLAVHGTYYEAWKMIKRTGLSKMQRNHIHLAKDLPGSSGVISGMRANCEVLIWVDLAKADSAGIRFFQSANGVILTEGDDGVLDPNFFHAVVDRNSHASLV